MFKASLSLFNTLKKAWDQAPFVQRADSAMFLFITKIMKVRAVRHPLVSIGNIFDPSRYVEQIEQFCYVELNSSMQLFYRLPPPMLTAHPLVKHCIDVDMPIW